MSFSTRMRRCSAAFVMRSLACLALGCDAASEDRTDIRTQDLGTDDDQAREVARIPERCLLAGQERLERETMFTFIALEYDISVEMTCETRLLTAGMTSDQHADWGNYLANYTSALFECGLLFTPLPGGVREFGPGHVEAVGVPNPSFGPDDAALLIQLYLAAVASLLALSPSQLAPIRSDLETAAANRVETELRSQISACEL